jgi:hypothetical protein
MGESFDHGPPGWVGQSGKRCVQSIHNRMVVDYPTMSSVDFGMPDFCLLIANVARGFCSLNAAPPTKGNLVNLDANAH